MKPSIRARRAALRGRQRDNRPWTPYRSDDVRVVRREKRREARAWGGTPLFVELTGLDVFILNRYAVLNHIAQIVKPEDMSAEDMQRVVRQVLTSKDKGCTHGPEEPCFTPSSEQDVWSAIQGYRAGQD